MPVPERRSPSTPRFLHRAIQSDAACSIGRALLGTAASLIALPVALAAPGPATQHGRTAAGTVVASLGGDLQQAQQRDQFAAFETQTGEAVHVQSWDGTLATLQGRAAAGETGWSLLLMDEAGVRVACREGLLLPDPLTRDPQDRRPDSSGQGCGVPAGHIDLVLAWDKSRVDSAPGWADFWDVARRPGKRGLQRDPRGTLEIALMADGVAPPDVYRTLATPDGVDRAFRKLDQLKPYIVWWNTPAAAEQILESGGVLMTSAAVGEIDAANRDGHHSFGTQWTGSLGMTLDWAVPRETDPEERGKAQRLLAFLNRPAAPAGTAPAQAATNAAPPPAGAASPSSGPGADSKAADAKPPAQAPHATLSLDDGFWAEHLVALRQRFDHWLGAR